MATVRQALLSSLSSLSRLRPKGAPFLAYLRKAHNRYFLRVKKWVLKASFVSYTFRAMQHTFGYARVSAADQNLDTQLEDLTRAGCSRIFQEKVSGTRTRSHAHATTGGPSYGAHNSPAQSTRAFRACFPFFFSVVPSAMTYAHAMDAYALAAGRGASGLGPSASPHAAWRAALEPGLRGSA